MSALVGERVAGRAREPVALAVEREGVARELAFGLVFALEHGDVRLDLPLNQPCEERACSVGPVGREAVRLDAKAISGPFQHALGRDDLLAEPGRRRLHVQNDGVSRVDQVVGLIAELAGPMLDRPSRVRVGLREVLGGGMLALVLRGRRRSVERFKVLADRSRLGFSIRPGLRDAVAAQAALAAGICVDDAPVHGGTLA